MAKSEGRKIATMVMATKIPPLPLGKGPAPVLLKALSWDRKILSREQEGSVAWIS